MPELHRLNRADLITVALCVALQWAPDRVSAQAAQPADRVHLDVKLHLGSNIRLLGRDPAQLVDPNANDGNLNFDKGAVNAGTALHASGGFSNGPLEGAAKVVLFHDFLLHNGRTDLARLPNASINRVGQGAYLGPAWLGLNQAVNGGAAKVRLGNQVFSWGASSSLENQLNLANPLILSRLWLPGGSEEEARAAIPALSASWKSSAGWLLEGFYGFGFKSSEPEPLGSLFSPNDYYSPGGSMLIAGTGNPALDAALGTVVSRGPDRRPKDQGGGVQLRSPELGGDLRAKLGIYAGRFSVAETLASATVGSVFGPPGNFAATSRYFIEHPGKVPLLGFSLVMHPSASNQLRLDYSVRRNNPLQIDDREMIGAVQLIGACAATGDPALCGAASQNRVVRRQTGAVALTQVAAIGLSGADISGVSRHDLGQWIVGFTQGLPNVLGSKLVLLDFEHVAQSISGYDASLLPLRADRGVASGAVASKTAALYRIGLKMDWGPTALANTHSVFAQFQRDYHGRAATPRDIAFAGRRSLTLGGSMDFAKNWSAHAVWIGQLGRGTEADTEHDRRVLNLGLSYKF